MKLEVKIVRKKAEIRREPRFSSPVILNVSEPDDLVLTSTKLYHGWYYIEDYKGWAECNDLMLVQIIEPFDPASEDYSPESETVIGGGSMAYNGDNLIIAINSAAHKLINANKVAFVDPNTGETVGIYTLLKEVKDENTDVQKIINDLKDIPDIPKIEEASQGKVLLVDSTNNASWKTMSYSDLSDLPEDSEIYANDF